MVLKNFLDDSVLSQCQKVGYACDMCPQICHEACHVLACCEGMGLAVSHVLFVSVE